MWRSGLLLRPSRCRSAPRISHVRRLLLQIYAQYLPLHLLADRLHTPTPRGTPILLPFSLPAQSCSHRNERFPRQAMYAYLQQSRLAHFLPHS